MAAVGPVAGASQARAWWLAARPRTLGVGAAPVLVGTALAWLHGSARAAPAGVALVAAVLIQVGANLANDVFDHERGADGPDRLGPARASQLGWLTPLELKRAAAGALGAAALAGLYLASIGGWPIVAVGLVSLAAAVAYTGGPWPLGYHGLGDLAVFVFFGAVAVCGTFYVQTLTLTPAAVAASIPLGALATAVLVVNNLRDLETDRRAGKRTLAVRLGRRGTLWEYAALVLLPYALVPAFALGVGLPLALPLLSLPSAVSLLRRVIRHPSGSGLNAALADTARLCLVWAALFAAGVVASGWIGTDA